MTIRTYRLALIVFIAALATTAAAVAAVPTLIRGSDVAGTQLQRSTWEVAGRSCSGAIGAASCSASVGPLSSTSPAQKSDAYVTITANAFVTSGDIGTLRLFATTGGTRALVSPGYRVVTGPIETGQALGRTSTTGTWRLPNLAPGTKVDLHPTLFVKNGSTATKVGAGLGGGVVSIEYSTSRD